MAPEGLSGLLPASLVRGTMAVEGGSSLAQEQTDSCVPAEPKVGEPEPL